MQTLSLVKDLPAKLLQPTVIAAIASIGLHSLLAAALPNLSTVGEVKEEPMADNIEVVELTPAEQERLPDISPLPFQAYQTQPLSSVPLLPPHNNFSATIPDIRLPPVRTSDLPLIPPSDRSSATKTKPKKPPTTAKATKTRKPVKTTKTNKTAKVDRPRNSKPATGTYRVFNQSTLKGKELRTAPDETFVDLPRASAQKPPQPTNPKPTNSKPRTNKRPQRSTANNRPKPNRGRTRIARNPNNSQSPTAKKPQKPIARASRTAPPPSTPNPQASRTAPTTSTPNPQASTTPTPTIDNQTPETTTQPSLAEQEIQRNLLTRNETNTSDREAQRNYLNWIATINQGGKREDITITGTYPPDACVKQLDGTAIVGVLVDGNNNPMGEGKLIKSSGYPVFDLPALGDALTTTFDNKTGRSKIYLVTVEYKYNSEVCSPAGGEGGRERGREGGNS
jgi:hypothetical protein